MSKTKQITIQKKPSAIESFETWYDDHVSMLIEHCAVGLVTVAIGFALYNYGDLRGVILMMLGFFISLILIYFYFTSPGSPYRNKDKPV